jgi:hypothetical protein
MAQPSDVAKQMLVYTVRLPCRRSWVRVPSSAPPGDFRVRIARIDARLLELRGAGRDMELLARVARIDRRVIGDAMARGRLAA